MLYNCLAFFKVLLLISTPCFKLTMLGGAGYMLPFTVCCGRYTPGIEMESGILEGLCDHLR